MQRDGGGLQRSEKGWHRASWKGGLPKKRGVPHYWLVRLRGGSRDGVQAGLGGRTPAFIGWADDCLPRPEASLPILFGGEGEPWPIGHASLRPAEHHCDRLLLGAYAGPRGPPVTSGAFMSEDER